MSRFLPAAAFALLTFSAVATYGQTPARSTTSAFPEGRIEGRVLDDRQVPIAGAMVSVVGRATAVATTDRNGRYTLKDLPFGPYVLSVHSRGYWRSPGRTLQLTASKLSAEVQLTRVRSEKAPVASAPAVPTRFAGFGELDTQVLTPEPAAEPLPPADAAVDDDGGETAWRLRHLPRSILKETPTEVVWVTNRGVEPGAQWREHDRDAAGAIALFNNLALTGQINLLTSESFNTPGQLLGAEGGRGIAFVSVGTQAAGGVWSMQGAMTQGDLASWIVAGSYKSVDSANHAYDLGLSYSTQRYDGGNAVALAAIRDNARNVGAVYGYDQWTVSPRFILGYGSEYARYDYLGGSGLVSPRVNVTIPFGAARVRAVVSSRAVVPGAEEFAPSVAGLWLPPERTFSSLEPDSRFRSERTSHAEVSIERDLATGVTVRVRGFGQHVNDQLIEMFGVDLPGRPETPLGHYFVGTAGDVDARGWGVGMTQEVPGYLRGTIEYTVATAYWTPASEGALVSRSLLVAPPATSENIHDLQAAVEATIPQTSTRVYAMYRVNTAFWSPRAEALVQPNSNARFNVRVNQSLPFLRFSSADWEMLLDVRNTFREADPLASVYDEALAVRAPKRIVGGLLVRF